MDRKLVAKGDAVFAAAYYYAELNCANMLRNLNIPMLEAENLPAQDMAIRKRLERMAENLSMELDELQLKAVEESIKNGLFILSGGPGTGKTTTIKMMSTLIRPSARMSRPSVGSSRKRIFGSLIRESAMDTFLCQPPDRVLAFCDSTSES